MTIKKILSIIVILIISFQIKAQIVKDQAIDVSIGYGLSSPYDDNVGVLGTGFYTQGEYVFTLAKWIDARPYVGLIFTQVRDNEDSSSSKYESSTNALLLGGKVRMKAPIPWVAPYLEFGLGISIGNFETITTFNDFEQRGVIMHVPFSIGLEIGKNTILI